MMFVNERYYKVIILNVYNWYYRSQGSACHPSSSRWSRTGHISWHGSSTGPGSSSAAWGPAPSTSPPATPSSLQLYHGNVHVQFVHVRRGISESAVHDEDRSSLLRAHAPFVRPAIPPATPTIHIQTPLLQALHLQPLTPSQSASTHPILPPSRLQPQLPPSAPAYATRAQCAPSGNGLPPAGYPPPPANLRCRCRPTACHLWQEWTEGLGWDERWLNQSFTSWFRPTIHVPVYYIHSLYGVYMYSDAGFTGRYRHFSCRDQRWLNWSVWEFMKYHRLLLGFRVSLFCRLYIHWCDLKG